MCVQGRDRPTLRPYIPSYYYDKQLPYTASEKPIGRGQRRIQIKFFGGENLILGKRH